MSRYRTPQLGASLCRLAQKKRDPVVKITLVVGIPLEKQCLERQKRWSRGLFETEY